MFVSAADDEETTDGWEEEDEVDPELGDGGDGGGVVLQGCSWGERVLSIAHQVLLLRADSDDIKLFAFKTTPRGYVYVRLDKLSQKYVHISFIHLSNPYRTLFIFFYCFTNFLILFCIIKLDYIDKGSLALVVGIFEIKLQNQSSNSGTVNIVSLLPIKLLCELQSVESDVVKLGQTPNPQRC